MELRAPADFAFDPDTAALGFDKVFGNGQTKSGATHLVRSRDINTVEAFENARLVGPWDTDASVGDREGYLVAVGGSADADLAAGRSVLNGIVEQVLKHFGEPRAVCGDVRQALR